MPKLTPAQRQRIPQWSLKYAKAGWGDGSGYPGRRNNPACSYVHHGLEYSCCDGATATYGHAGLPMRGGMQPGMSEGAAYVPDLYAFARKHKGGIRPSWKAEVGDCLLVDTGHGAQPGHIEVIYDVEDADGIVHLYSVGWDSGPSNIDNYRGQGGVHRHVWVSTVGKGNPAIYAVANADVLVDFTRIRQPASRVKAAAAKPLHKTADGRIKERDREARAWRRLVRKIKHGW